MQPVYRSEKVSWVSGAKKTVPMDFLPLVGPKGGRLVIDKIQIESHLNLTTASGVTMTAGDQASFIARLRMADLAGNRRYLSGAKTRVKGFEDLGLQYPAEPAAVAASQTGIDQTYTHCLAFARPLARRPWDYALPVEDLIFGGALEIQMPASSDLLYSGGSAPTINSGDYQVFVWTREERSLEYKCRDVVEEFATTSNTNWYLQVAGRLLRAATAFKDAASNGTSVVTVTDLSIDQFGMVAMPRSQFLSQYRATTIRDTTRDPACQATPLSLPFVFGHEDGKVNDLPLISGQLLVRANSTMTTPDIILSTIAPRDERMMRASAARNKAPANAKLVVKGADGSNIDLAKFGAYARFMPVVVQA